MQTVCLVPEECLIYSEAVNNNLPAVPFRILTINQVNQAF